MNISSIKPGLYEAITYTTLILGVTGDHISTSIALSRGGVQETNPLALNLMNQGIWTQTDALLVTLLVLCSFIVTRVVNKPFTKMLLVPILLSGLNRVIVTISNFSLLL